MICTQFYLNHFVKRFLWYLVAFIFMFLSFYELYSMVYDMLLYNTQQTDQITQDTI